MLILWAACLISLVFLAADARGAKNQLPPQYKKWLEEEVVYIISSRERDVFLQLKTDRERDLFMEAFWKHRDPTPGSPENEFKTEHYRRINYVNQFFGRSSPLPGWKTDRGRMYIILGEPNDIQRFVGKSDVYPTEVWFYQGKTGEGLPAGFNLVFFQEHGNGEYKLYSPVRDGPQALMTTFSGDPSNYLAAYQKLQEIDPTLAEVSLSLIPGEESGSFGRPSLSSDLLIQKVEMLPAKQVEDKYAQKFLQYKDSVEVEYTANYIDSDSLVKVLRDPSGRPFVHYALEPARLSVNQYESKYYSTLALNGSVSSPEGKTIFQFDKTISVEFNEEQMQNVSRRPFDIHDMIPLIPGRYKLSILLKNEVSKEFTSLEQNLVVPQESDGPAMTSLILGYKIAKAEAGVKKMKPFQVGAYQIFAQPNRVFVRKDSLALAFQVQGLTPEIREKGEIRYLFTTADKEFRSSSRKIPEYGDVTDFVQEMQLADFPPAHYGVRVSLVLDGQELAAKEDEFDVTHLEGVARPWIYTRILPDSSDPMYAYITGIQLINSGRFKEASESLEKARQGKPDGVDINYHLARAYMGLDAYEKVEPLLLPFFNKPETPKYELYFLLGQAYYLRGEWQKVIALYDQAINHYGVNTSILNLLGQSYLKLGKTEEALLAWKKSLEIDPRQPQIQKAAESAKEKK